jgi:hypothetical protein
MLLIVRDNTDRSWHLLGYKLHEFDLFDTSRYTVGAVSYKLNDRSVTQAIETQQTLAKMAGDSIESYMQQRQSEISAIAALPLLNDARIWNSLSQEDKFAALD